MPHTQLIATADDLAALEGPWNALADGMPLRSWAWLVAWWNYYGPAANGSRPVDRQLHVVAVYDDDAEPTGKLIGIAPWYLDDSKIQGRVIRPLGSGDICTDHLSLICRPSDTDRVAAAIAEYLTTTDDQWDRLELCAIDADDVPIARLADELAERTCVVSRTPADNCWVIDLPATWEEFLASQSKSHRKQPPSSSRPGSRSGRSMC